MECLLLILRGQWRQQQLGGGGVFYSDHAAYSTRAGAQAGWSGYGDGSAYGSDGVRSAYGGDEYGNAGGAAYGGGEPGYNVAYADQLAYVDQLAYGEQLTRAIEQNRYASPDTGTFNLMYLCLNLSASPAGHFCSYWHM